MDIFAGNVPFGTKRGKVVLEYFIINVHNMARLLFVLPDQGYPGAAVRQTPVNRYVQGLPAPASCPAFREAPESGRAVWPAGRMVSWQAVWAGKTKRKGLRKDGREKDF